jgi:zinc transporter ZupT
LPKKLSRSASWNLVALLMLLWLILGLVGFWIGSALESTQSKKLASGLFGVAAGSFVWIGCCWIIAFVMRSWLLRRGCGERSGPQA